MPNTIELEINTPTDAAAKRIMMLIETGYLPPLVKSDLDILMRGALAWDLFTRKPATADNRTGLAND